MKWLAIFLVLAAMPFATMSAYVPPPETDCAMSCCESQADAGCAKSCSPCPPAHVLTMTIPVLHTCVISRVDEPRNLPADFLVPASISHRPPVPPPRA